MASTRYQAIALFFASTAVMAAGITPAMAHAIVESSDPPANRLLLKPPNEVVLRFSEPIDPLRTEIKVLNQEGQRIERDQAVLAPDRRQARLPVRLPGPGIYTVTWKTFSTLDLHAYEGFFTFTLGPLRPGSFALQGGTAAGPAAWEVGARWLMFVGAAVITGGQALHRFLLPSALAVLQPDEVWLAGLHRRWRLSTWLGTALFLTGAFGEVAGQAARIAAAAGETVLATLIQLATGDLTRTPLILKILTAVLLLGLLQRRVPPMTLRLSAGFVATIPAPVGATAELVLAGLLLLGITLTSHAAAAQVPLPVIADWLHLLSAAMWVGGLVYLGIVLAPVLSRLKADDRSNFLGQLAQQFSNLAFTSLSVLILTGLYAAWVNIPALDAVTATSYGRTLFVKLALLVPLLAIAAINLLVMRPRLVVAAQKLLADPRAVALQQRFIRLVRSEAALACLVLLAAAILALLPTARQAVALGPGREIALVRRSNSVEGVLRIAPYQVGANTLELRLRNLQSELSIPDARVRFTFLPLAASLGTTIADAAPQSDGRYLVQGTHIGTRGPWLIAATVRRRGQEDVQLLYPVEPDWIRGTPITPATDPSASTLLREADEAMNRLRSLRQRQEITDGAGNDVITFFELAAPDAMHYRVVGGNEVVIIGETQFIKEGDTWRREPGFGFKFPNFTFSNNASSVSLGPRELIDGTPTQVVTFILTIAGARARYSVWIDERTHRIVQDAMVARSHYMTIRNYDFNAPVRIRVPTSRQ